MRVQQMRHKLAKPELGEKRICLECSTKYYDLNRDPITCPKCGAIFEQHVTDKAKPEKEAEAKEAADDADDELEADGPEIISLEDADDDDGDTVDGDVDDDIPTDIPDVEIDDDDDDDAVDGPFLDDEDDDNDNLADIIPVHGDDNEDT